MKPESKRAQRRHARWRKVEKAKRVFSASDKRTWPSEVVSKRREHDAEKHADNMKSTQCMCCSNLRENFGPSFSEHRRIVAAEADLQESDTPQKDRASV